MPSARHAANSAPADAPAVTQVPDAHTRPASHAAAVWRQLQPPHPSTAMHAGKFSVLPLQPPVCDSTLHNNEGHDKHIVADQRARTSDRERRRLLLAL